MPRTMRSDRGSTLDTWELDRHLTELRETQNFVVGILGRVDDTLRHQARRIFSAAAASWLSNPASARRTPGCTSSTPSGTSTPAGRRREDEKVRIGHVEEDSEVRFQLRPPGPLAWPHGGLESGLPQVLIQPVLRRRLRRCWRPAIPGGDFYRNYCDGFAHCFRASVAEAHADHASGKPLADRPDAFCDL